MSTVIKIVEMLDTRYPVTQDEAQKVYPVLEGAVLERREVVLSFENIENCATIFLSGLLGKLYFNYALIVDRYVRIENVISDENDIRGRIARIKKQALSVATNNASKKKSVSVY